MRRLLSFFLTSLIAVCAVARANDGDAIPAWMTFGGGPRAYAFALDPAHPRGGGPSLRIAALEPAAEEFGASAWSVDASPYRGKRVRLSGEVRTAAAGSASLWLRVDGSKIGGFDNMTAQTGSDRALHGTRDWTPLQIELDVPGDAAALVFGDLLTGTGTMWSTYPRLLVTGEARSAAARAAHPAGMIEPAQRAPVEAALRVDAVPLHGVDPNAPLDDLAAFDRDVAHARLVGLGEATHGTADFFRMKHRLFRDLVERHGVTVFAFEANLPEAREVDRYVTTGAGDPAEALHAMHFWVWQTEEVLALVKWMRAYDAAPGKHPTLHFAGFDAQWGVVAAANVERFVAAHDPPAAAAFKARYACVQTSYAAASALSADAKHACAASMDAAAAALEKLHPDADTARDARVLQQYAAILMGPPGSGFAERDAAMAENVEWLVRTRYPHAKIALWAHNFHIGANANPATPKLATMGAHLHERFGPDYVRVGFAFDRGTASAIVHDELGPQTIAPAPAGTLEGVLRETGRSALYLPLRTLSANDPVAAWLDGGTLRREFGSGFDPSSPNTMWAVQKERERFDALIYLAETRASALLPAAASSRPKPIASPTSSVPAATTSQ